MNRRGTPVSRIVDEEHMKLVTRRVSSMSYIRLIYLLGVGPTRWVEKPSLFQ